VSILVKIYAVGSQKEARVTVRKPPFRHFLGFTRTDSGRQPIRMRESFKDFLTQNFLTAQNKTRETRTAQKENAEMQ